MFDDLAVQRRLLSGPLRIERYKPRYQMRIRKIWRYMRYCHA